MPSNEDREKLVSWDDDICDLRFGGSIFKGISLHLPHMAIDGLDTKTAPLTALGDRSDSCPSLMLASLIPHDTPRRYYGPSVMPSSKSELGHECNRGYGSWTGAGNTPSIYWLCAGCSRMNFVRSDEGCPNCNHARNDTREEFSGVRFFDNNRRSTEGELSSLYDLELGTIPPLCREILPLVTSKDKNHNEKVFSIHIYPEYQSFPSTSPIVIARKDISQIQEWQTRKNEVGILKRLGERSHTHIVRLIATYSPSLNFQCPPQLLGRTTSHSAGRDIMSLLCLLGGSVSALGLAQNLHPPGEMGGWTRKNLPQDLGSTFCSSCGAWTNIAFLAGFTVSTACFYRLNKQNKFQDYATLLGIIGGVVTGFGTGKDLQDTLLLVVPWTVLLALAMSGVGHGISRRTAKWSSPSEGVDGEEGWASTEEKRLDEQF